MGGYMTSAFTELTDLAAERLGGCALFASDEFFAEKENLLKAGDGVFIADKYTENGKWMDGWESRRKRVPGYDYCVIRLGLSGRLRGVDINTNHFLGNYPEAAALDVCEAPLDASVAMLESESVEWKEVVPLSRLQGGTHNLFAIDHDARITHVRLRIYPDGGVARLRVYGDVLPDWPALLATGEPIDLASVTNGGVAVLANDMFFGHRGNLIMPGRAANMGDGWETKRKRGPGNDWVIVQLGRPGTLSQVEVDTNHFKGNFPDRCSLEGTMLPPGVPTEFLTSLAIEWKPIVPVTSLQAHHRHYFADELLPGGPYSHVRLSIFPDGGVSRLRLWGRPVESWS